MKAQYYFATAGGASLTCMGWHFNIVNCKNGGMSRKEGQNYRYTMLYSTCVCERTQ